MSRIWPEIRPRFYAGINTPSSIHSNKIGWVCSSICPLISPCSRDSSACWGVVWGDGLQPLGAYQGERHKFHRKVSVAVHHIGAGVWGWVGVVRADQVHRVGVDQAPGQGRALPGALPGVSPGAAGGLAEASQLYPGPTPPIHSGPVQGYTRARRLARAVC